MSNVPPTKLKMFNNCLQFISNYTERHDELRISNCNNFCNNFFIYTLQDEYSIIPQSYVVDNHGYILVYSVTSLKR